MISLAELRRGLMYVLAYTVFVVIAHLLLAISQGVYYPLERAGTLSLELLLGLAVMTFAAIHPVLGIIVLHILLFFGGIPATEMITTTMGIPRGLGLLIAQIVYLPALADYFIVGLVSIMLGYLIGRRTIPNIQEMIEALFRIKR